MMETLNRLHNQIVGLVALVVLVAGFVLAPEERLDKVGHALVAFGSTSAGQTVYAALTALVVAAFRWALARIPSTDSRPQRVPPGSGALLLALALGAATQGCGASALSQHGSGVAITMLAVRGAADAADAERQATEHACQTEACLTAAIEARRPVVAALDVTRTAVLAWRDSVQVALEADAQAPDVLSALLTAAARVVARWADLVAAFRVVGIEVPALPASVAALVGG